MDREELNGWLRLTLTPGVGNDTARRLLAAFGPPDAIFAQPSAALRQLLTSAQVSAMAEPPDGLAEALDSTLAWLAADGQDDARRCVVPLGDPRYPAALLRIEDPPPLLYMLGQVPATDSVPFGAPDGTGRAQEATPTIANLYPPAVAMVGSRNPTRGSIDAVPSPTSTTTMARGVSNAPASLGEKPYASVAYRGRNEKAPNNVAP